MDFFYLEYASLAIAVVWFARRIAIAETKSNRDQSDYSNDALIRGAGDTLGKRKGGQKHKVWKQGI